jgi:CRISPR-associated endonuclease Csn1
MFKMYQFEKDGRIKFRHHLAAGIDTELKKLYSEDNSFIIGKQQVFLRLTQGQWNFAIEGKDFEMYIDGTIKWNF